MTSYGSKRARWLAALFALTLCAALPFTCWDRAEYAQAPPPATVEEQELDPDGALHDAMDKRQKTELAARLAPLRSLGYSSGDEVAGAASLRGASKKARAQGPDDAALSELDYQTHQSLNQRANEAFDYLGRKAPDTRVALDVAKSRSAAPRRVLRNGGDLLLEKDAWRYRDRLTAGLRSENRPVGGFAGGAGRADDEEGGAASHESQVTTPAQRYQQQRRALEGLVVQPASGYWANTYVPGDPVMRWLESRLEKRDRAALQPFAKRRLRLEAAAHQTRQPFDPPRNAAVSIFVQADRRGLEGESRMLVQVGLQGAQRHSGLRPAMSVGVVLDLRGQISTEAAQSMRALLDGFLRVKDVGDRFSLTLAGRPGGTLVDPDAFRHGPLSLAMARILEPAGRGGAGEPILGLEEAVRSTAARLRSADDPTAPLGSSLVLLVTSQPLGAVTSRLVATAHESAVAGVPTTVVGIGDRVDLAEIERIALAGQGNRRLLQAPAEAERLVERELSALSRVIARALRLRIRLAPGVKLVEVVGSERLDAAGAQRVRQAERSIDRRLARNLGIEADRGEDEEGIQIVMPIFQSGDAHAVLLDVVAPGPGPIADVTVRYKDLVYLRNNVARANLTLGRSSAPPGPLERNVVKNHLAIRLSQTLKQAGRDLLAGSDAQAIASVREFQQLLDGLRRELPGFQNDADFANDAGMLGEYLALLDTGALQQEAPRLYLADSLQLSGYFKTVPRSTSDLKISRRY